MKKKLMYSVRCAIDNVRFLSSHESIITFLKKPNKIKSYEIGIKEKDFSLLKASTILRGPIINILSASGKIEFSKINYLMKNTSFINLKFDIEKEKYKDFNKIIYENIVDLYDRSITLYSMIKKRMIDKGLDYVDSTYEFNENLFNMILNNIESYGFKNYSDITDKIIISEIVKYFRSI